MQGLPPLDMETNTLYKKGIRTHLLTTTVRATRSYSFNIGLAGVVEIVAYFGSMLTSLHIGRMLVITRIVVAAAVVHILYFFAPLLAGSSLGRFIILVLDVLVRVIVAFGNTFLAIYSI